jgi:small subunit ribosomal protein S7
MGKKFKSTKVYLKPDPIFHDKLITQFINYIMWDGKKNIAQRVFYDALLLLRERFAGAEVAEKDDKYELKVFKTAVNNAKPLMEVRPRRIGGATYQVPMEVEKRRQTSLALRWILQASRARKGKPMAERLADELTDAYKKQGKAISQRENVHRMAEANKAFAHFAW